MSQWHLYFDCITKVVSNILWVYCSNLLSMLYGGFGYQMSWKSLFLVRLISNCYCFSGIRPFSLYVCVNVIQCLFIRKWWINIYLFYFVVTFQCLCIRRWNSITIMHVELLPMLCWKFPRKLLNDIRCIVMLQMTSVTHLHDVTTNTSKQIHWYKNTDELP